MEIAGLIWGIFGEAEGDPGGDEEKSSDGGYGAEEGDVGDAEEVQTTREDEGAGEPKLIG